MADRLLEVEGLAKYFRGGGNWLTSGGDSIRAVDGVSFHVEEGETFALVGESGCGKTTVAKMILLLENPTRGTISFQGEDVRRFRGGGLREYKRLVQAVFQDPYSSTLECRSWTSSASRCASTSTCGGGTCACGWANCWKTWG